MAAVAQNVLSPGSMSIDTHDREAPRAGLRLKLFSRAGRCGVRSYNARMGALTFGMALSLLPLLVATIMTPEGEPSGAVFAIGATIFVMSFIAFMSGFVFNTAQRLHDLGRTGWFLLIAFIPVIGTLFQCYVSYVPGKPEANSYGEQHEPSKASRVVGPVVIALGALTMLGYGVAIVTGSVSA